MDVFRTEEGREKILKASRELYSRCPVDSESRFLDTGEYGPTHVLIAGNPAGTPLVLLHGTSNNSSSWFGELPVLAEDFRIYALDIPGQPGLSGSTRPHFADGSMRRWFESSITRLNLEKFHLCGRSMGGWISLDYSFIHPEKILRMVLLAPGGLARFRPSFTLKMIPLVLQGKRGMKKINRMIYGELPLPREYESFSILVFRHFRPVLEKVPVFSDESLKKIPFPLLYIGGEKDPLLNTRKSAERLKRLIPEAEIFILKDTSHAVRNRDSLIRDFLNRS